MDDLRRWFRNLRSHHPLSSDTARPLHRSVRWAVDRHRVCQRAVNLSAPCPHISRIPIRVRQLRMLHGAGSGNFRIDHRYRFALSIEAEP